MGYVIGAVLFIYTCSVFPLWFKRPNPVVFIPFDFVVLAAYLWYISFELGQDWIWSLALPVEAMVFVIVMSLVVFLRKLKAGRLYVFGGTFMGLGAMMILIELLIDVTFGVKFFGWSFYPFAVLFLFGCALIFLAINSSARESMERRFFL